MPPGLTSPGEAGTDLAVEEGGELGCGLGEEAGRRDAPRVRGGVAGVGQPLQPVPVGEGGGREGGQDGQVVGGMERGDLADQGSSQGAGPAGRAGAGHNAEVAQRNRDRDVREPSGLAGEVLGGLQQLRVMLDDRAGGGGEPDRSGQRNRAAADADGEVVLIGRAPLPEPLDPVDQRPQLGQVGVEMVGDPELERRQPGRLVAHPIQVDEVAGPLPAPRPAGGPPLDQAQREPQPDRGEGGADDDGDQPGGAGTGNGEQEHDRTAAAQQRHQVLQPAGDAGAGPPHRGWGRDRQLGRRKRPRVGPGRPMHQELAWLRVGWRLGVAAEPTHMEAAERSGREGRGRHAGTVRRRTRASAPDREGVDNFVGAGEVLGAVRGA
jgi:hypothetical protein